MCKVVFVYSRGRASQNGYLPARTGCNSMFIPRYWDTIITIIHSIGSLSSPNSMVNNYISHSPYIVVIHVLNQGIQLLERTITRVETVQVLWQITCGKTHQTCFSTTMLWIRKSNAKLVTSLPSWDSDCVGGGSHAAVNPDLAMSETLPSKLLHQLCLWDSQLKACNTTDINRYLRELVLFVAWLFCYHGRHYT
jgi:hypothetical protein